MQHQGFCKTGVKLARRKVLPIILSAICLGQNALAQEAAPGAEAGTSPAGLRVVAWNLEWYPGMNPRPSLEAEQVHEKALIATLPELKADVLCAQEVVSARSLGRAVQAQPGYKVNVVSDFADGPLELAIASRFDHVEAGQVAYVANGAVQPPRGFVYAVLDVGGGNLLLVYSIHLKSNRGEASENYPMREEAAIQLGAHLHATVERLRGALSYRKIAAMICGDFNSDPANGKWVGDGTWAAMNKAGLKWGWEGVPEAERNTWVGNERFEPTCFDHIMYLPAEGISYSTTRMLKPSQPMGDHLPILMEVTP